MPCHLVVMYSPAIYCGVAEPRPSGSGLSFRLAPKPASGFILIYPYTHYPFTLRLRRINPLTLHSEPFSLLTSLYPNPSPDASFINSCEYRANRKDGE
jgi:hypothetical protein